MLNYKRFTFNYRHSVYCISKYYLHHKAHMGNNGIPHHNVGVISNALGHSSVKVTETYLKPFENEALDRTNKKIIAYVKKCSIRQG